MEKTIYILDSNFRHEAELAAWLKRPQNFVALTDIMQTEVFKGSEPRSILWSIELLKEFSDKVIVLKTTHDILRLPVIEKGLRRRLIDHPGTEGYPAFCRAVGQMETDTAIFEQIVERQRWANEDVERMKAGLGDYGDAIRELMNEFSLEERKILRSGERYPRALAGKILDGITRVALHLVRQIYRDSMRFTGPIYNLHAFRYALCAFLLALRRVADGGNVTKDLDKLVNDGYDMSYCAYATYFDGFFSKDRQAIAIYEEACVVLRGIKRALGR